MSGLPHRHARQRLTLSPRRPSSHRKWRRAFLAYGDVCNIRWSRSVPSTLFCGPANGLPASRPAAALIVPGLARSLRASWTSASSWRCASDSCGRAPSVEDPDLLARHRNGTGARVRIDVSDTSAFRPPPTSSPTPNRPRAPQFQIIDTQRATLSLTGHRSTFCSPYSVTAPSASPGPLQPAVELRGHLPAAPRGRPRDRTRSPGSRSRLRQS